MKLKTTYEYESCPLQNEEAEFIINWKSPGTLGSTRNQWKVSGVSCALREQDMCPEENEICETMMSFYFK